MSHEFDASENFITDLLESSSLSHYGVLGMHWGRHMPGKGVEVSADHQKVSELNKKHPSTLSTAELKLVNDRKQAETKYKQLNPDSVTKGKKAAAGVLAAAGTAVTVYNLVKSPAGKDAIKFGKKAYRNALIRIVENVG